MYINKLGRFSNIALQLALWPCYCATPCCEEEHLPPRSAPYRWSYLVSDKLPGQYTGTSSQINSLGNTQVEPSLPDQLPGEHTGGAIPPRLTSSGTYRSASSVGAVYTFLQSPFHCHHLTHIHSWEIEARWLGI